MAKNFLSYLFKCNTSQSIGNRFLFFPGHLGEKVCQVEGFTRAAGQAPFPQKADTEVGWRLPGRGHLLGSLGITLWFLRWKGTEVFLTPGIKMIQAVLQFQAPGFQGGTPLLGRDPKGRAQEDGASAQGQRDLKTVPGVEGNLAAGRHRQRDNGGLGLPGQI
jgi:hypothetical protein